MARLDKKPLPSCSLKVGDEISLRSQKGRAVVVDAADKEKRTSVDGVVTSISKTEIEITVQPEDEAVADITEPLRLDIRASEATFQKLMDVVHKLEEHSLSHPLVSLLFQKSVRMPSETTTMQPAECNWIQNELAVEEVGKVEPVNKCLNTSQLDAIRCALGAKRLALIHGPVRHDDAHDSYCVLYRIQNSKIDGDFDVLS